MDSICKLVIGDSIRSYFLTLWFFFQFQGRSVPRRSSGRLFEKVWISTLLSYNPIACHIPKKIQPKLSWNASKRKSVPFIFCCWSSRSVYFWKINIKDLTFWNMLHLNWKIGLVSLLISAFVMVWDACTAYLTKIHNLFPYARVISRLCPKMIYCFLEPGVSREGRRKVCPAISCDWPQILQMAFLWWRPGGQE